MPVIHGFRAWEYDDGYLFSVACECGPWVKGVNKSIHSDCVNPCRGYISSKCTCGFYAMKTNEVTAQGKICSLISRMEAYQELLAEHGYLDSDILQQVMRFILRYVWGEVALWGKIVEYEYGYRAEYAQVEHLYITVPAEIMNPEDDIKIHWDSNFWRKHMKDGRRILSQNYDCDVDILIINKDDIFNELIRFRMD